MSHKVEELGKELGSLELASHSAKLRKNGQQASLSVTGFTITLI